VFFTDNCLLNLVNVNTNTFIEDVIVTYCTGGIRCEKFSGWLVKEGFENVGQLHGGIRIQSGKSLKRVISGRMAPRK
jgi:predicted sulfurtransferase